MMKPLACFALAALAVLGCVAAAAAQVHLLREVEEKLLREDPSKLVKEAAREVKIPVEPLKRVTRFLNSGDFGKIPIPEEKSVEYTRVKRFGTGFEETGIYALSSQSLGGGGGGGFGGSPGFGGGGGSGGASAQSSFGGGGGLGGLGGFGRR